MAKDAFLRNAGDMCYLLFLPSDNPYGIENRNALLFIYNKLQKYAILCISYVSRGFPIYRGFIVETIWNTSICNSIN
jgi:hypothetical protein